MPATEVRAFRDAKGAVPIQDWLDELELREPTVYAKCLARIIELQERGYEMRRPNADFLRDGIYELRATYQRIHYRILYFFHGKNAVTLSHGITKEKEVPKKEIDLATDRMLAVKQNAQKYTAELEIDENGQD
jgi:phage-related protein